MTTADLAPYRIVDCSSGLAGAYASKMFTDGGADVIVAEAPTGHVLRSWSCVGSKSDDEDGVLFRYLRHGQRSVAITSADQLGTLLDGADLVIVDEQTLFGIDVRALQRDRPGLVVISISAFGLDGPYAGRPSSELTVQAEGGALAIRGRVERPPLQAGGQVTEWVTGAYAAVAGLAALRRGHGELIDLSWCEVANMTCTLFADLFDSVGGGIDLTKAPPPRNFESPSVEPTLDGYVGFNTNTRQQFSDFLVMIERPEVLDDWMILTARMQRWDEWNAIVHEWTTKHTTEEIVELAALLRIPVAPVTNAQTVLEFEQAVARGVFVDDPTGTFRMPRRPWTIDDEAHPTPRPAPSIGQHDAAIESRSPVATVAATASTPMPFAGLKVVDLTGWWAGPSMASVFAMFGADVIHVESITHPDGIRMAGGAFFTRQRWWELSAFFLACNTNKRGLTLDLAAAAGRDLLLKLVADADIVVENFTPRVFEGFDLGWDVIHAANPRAVMVRMPAFGLDGPWRDRPGFAQTMEQVTGLAWLTGFVDDQPRIQRGPCDPNAGMHAAFATMVAVARRDRTGVGCLVEAPMVEAALAIAAEPVVEWTAYGNLLSRNGNRSLHAAPQGVYACRGIEQWLALSVTDDAQWDALCRVLGRPAWAADPVLTSPDGRREHHDALDRHLAGWAADHDVDDAVAALIAAGVPASHPVDPRRTREHPQFVARGYLEMVDHPVAGPVATVVPPYRFASIDRWINTPAPTLGEHNTEVLAQLGCTEADIESLAQAGVIGVTPAGY